MDLSASEKEMDDLFLYIFLPLFFEQIRIHDLFSSPAFRASRLSSPRRDFSSSSFRRRCRDFSRRAHNIPPLPSSSSSSAASVAVSHARSLAAGKQLSFPPRNMEEEYQKSVRNLPGAPLSDGLFIVDVGIFCARVYELSANDV